MNQAPARATEDGQVLDGLGVAVFEAAESQAMSVDVPAAADGGQGVRRRPAAFRQAIERERTLLPRSDVRQFLDGKVLRLLLELHGAETWRISAQKKRSKD